MSDDKVVPFPLLNLTDAAEGLHEWANRVRRGEATMKRVVLCWEDGDGHVQYSCLGESPFPSSMAVGILEFAKREITG